ncbi:hypothetical protein FVE85_1259 [Porphyridium purpureum]|uniref:RFTS domain-containing protein n=1 Tax=Porphyridium purpureum TaxID=35688 RepID=A0A5J4YID4_PORPP|nr:hypothetical protein FVE85_1259 [Porphyridium purpureum]|eukprot:POR8812..scf251_18
MSEDGADVDGMLLDPAACARLRSMWELPATFYLLRTCSVLLNVPAAKLGSVKQLEDTLLLACSGAGEQDEQDVEVARSTLRFVLCKLLGVTVGRAEQDDQAWLKMLRRHINRNLYFFEDTLRETRHALLLQKRKAVERHRHNEDGDSSFANDEDRDETDDDEDGPREGERSGDDEAEQEEAVDDFLLIQELREISSALTQSYEELVSIGGVTMLKMLYVVTEGVCTDERLFGEALRTMDPEIFRIEPIGYDARGRSFYLFGDDMRLYVENDVREQMDEQRAKKEEKKRKEREDRRKQSMEMEQKKRAKGNESRWAPRVAATRTTRASLAAGLLPDAASDTQSILNHDQDQGGAVASAHSFDDEDENSRNLDEASIDFTEAAADQAEPPDGDVNSSWQVVALAAAELRAFVDGLEKSKNRNEKALRKYLVESILPEWESAEKKLHRERDRRERVKEMAVVHEVRSSRVKLLQERKEAERLRQLELEAEERERAAEHARIRKVRREEQERMERERAAEKEAQEQRVAAQVSRNLESLFAAHDLARGAPGTAPESGALKATQQTVACDAGIVEPSSMASSLAPASAEVAAGARTEAGSGVDQQPREDDQGLGEWGAYLAKRLPKFKAPADSDASVELAESECPAELNWTSPSGDDGPERVLDNFRVFYAASGDLAKLEMADQVEDLVHGPRAMTVTGTLFPPPKSELTVAPRMIRICGIEEWVLDLGHDPIMYVRTASAWYRLRRPSKDYKWVFMTARRKFEVTARIFILADQLPLSQLRYDVVVPLLGASYTNMRSYKEAEVILEASFVVEQVRNLKHKALLNSQLLQKLEQIAKKSTPRKSGLTLARKRRLPMPPTPRRVQVAAAQSLVEAAAADSAAPEADAPVTEIALTATVENGLAHPAEYTEVIRSMCSAESAPKKSIERSKLQTLEVMGSPDQHTVYKAEIKDLKVMPSRDGETGGHAGEMPISEPFQSTVHRDLAADASGPVHATASTGRKTLTGPGGVPDGVSSEKRSKAEGDCGEPVMKPEPHEHLAGSQHVPPEKRSEEVVAIPNGLRNDKAVPVITQSVPSLQREPRNGGRDIAQELALKCESEGDGHQHVQQVPQ